MLIIGSLPFILGQELTSGLFLQGVVFIYIVDRGVVRHSSGFDLFCVSTDLAKYHIYYNIDIEYCELYNSTV